jgi:hypothetical protein
MPRKPSEAVQRALALIEQGVPPYRAAMECGLHPSTVYRARAKLRKGKVAK